MEERFIKFSLFSNFPEIIHGISNRSYGDMRFGKLQDTEIVKNREHFFANLGIKINDVVTCNQVHSNNLALVGENDKGRGSQEPQSEIPETDGLITKETGIFLMIKTADCLPCFFYDPTSQSVALVHAGWRGILKQIVLRSVDKLVDLGCNSENLIVGIGPGICQKHFVVKNSLLREFMESYPSATFVRNNDGYVDLKKAVVADLKKAKIPAANIEVSKYCTVCDNGIFGSFRKEGEGAPEIASVIGIRK